MLGTHICPVTCIHSNHPHAHVHTCSAHMCAHAHKPSAYTCTLSTHVYTPNIHVYTACTQHTHVTHMLGTHIYTHAQHTCTHPACAHIVHTCSARTHTVHMLSRHVHTHTHTHAHAQCTSDAVPLCVTQLQRSVQDVSDGEGYPCQMEIHACISTPGASCTLKTPRSRSSHQTQGTK